MTALVLVSALLLAFVNGANDNMKGVATLYGSGVLSYRKALALATLSTALGSMASIFIATALVRAFSAKGLVPDASLTPAFLAAVGVAAALTVLLATRRGFPVSTTHALVGGLTGAGWIAAGPALSLSALGAVFVVPLLAGPVIALALAWAGVGAGRAASRRLGVTYGACLCIGGEWVPAAVAPAALAMNGVASVSFSGTAQHVSLSVGESPDCRERYSGYLAGVEVDSAVSVGHVLSASLVGVARGLNDTPKILGLLVGASVLSPWAGALAIAAAMALGGLLAARPVTEMLAGRITPMTPGQGLAGNLATSLLVIGASRFGLPMSTTHVSTGGIFGIGAATGALNWRASGQILAAWVITLPLAALLGAGLMLGLR